MDGDRSRVATVPRRLTHTQAARTNVPEMKTMLLRISQVLLYVWLVIISILGGMKISDFINGGCE